MAREMSREKTAEASPYSVLLASSMTSASVLNFVMATTGPKISGGGDEQEKVSGCYERVMEEPKLSYVPSLKMVWSGLTSANTVGSMK
jgi:hypothetical protein